MANDITIKNGKELRKWGSFTLAFLLAIIGGVTWLNSLQGQVDENEEDIAEYCTVVDKRLGYIETHGTEKSQKNERDLIALKKDVQYTASTVKKIAEKLNIN